MTRTNETARLDRLLANMGYGSRKDIQTLVKAGRVTLDGAPIADAAEHVTLSPDLPRRLKIQGAPLDPLPGLVVLLHKPTGVTCSHKEAGPLVYGLLPPRWRVRKPALSTIGRLDKETSGLLLITDDGGLLHRVIAPKSTIAKRYRATLARPLRGDEAAILASGTLMLDGETEPLLPVAMEVYCAPTGPGASPSGGPTVQVTLTEGRYHQVRRMFAALGNHVVTLHRDQIGGLSLPPDLAAGSYRVLDGDAIAALFAPPPQ